MKLMLPYVGQKGFDSVIDKATALLAEEIERQPYDPRDFLLIGQVYTQKAEATGNKKYYEITESYLKRALALSPNRQELLYSLAVNYGDQKKFDLLKQYLDKMFSLGQDIPRVQFYYATGISIKGPSEYDNALSVLENLFSKVVIMPDDEEIEVLRNAYNKYLRYYYETKNHDNFLRTMNVALAIENAREQVLLSEYERGLIQDLPAKESTRFEQGIAMFKARGFDAIELKLTN